MLISIFLFTIAFLGCYDESTWYFVVVEINEISAVGEDEFEKICKHVQ